MPLSLSSEEMDILLALGRPLEQNQRDQFLREVAAEFEAAPAQTGVGPGLGVLHRIGRTAYGAFLSARIAELQPAREGLGGRHKR
jgi:hypothetical protein